MMAMRSQIERSSSSSEEVIIIVVPVSLFTLRNVSRTSFLAPTSIPRVGSETNRMSGATAKALARQTFCWLPPESSIALCFGPVQRISRDFIYSLVHSSIALSSRHFTKPPRRCLTNFSCTWSAVKVTFQSIPSSSSRPTPRRSSETNAIPSLREASGSLSLISLPRSKTLPPEIYRPIIPLEIPTLPCPAKPPRPKISPLCTLKETSRTVSPGMSTQRCSVLRMTSPISFLGALGSGSASAAIWRPTIQLAI